LLTVCKLLNHEKAQYLVVGGLACNLHGLIRATKDIDLLIPKDKENTQLVLSALENLTFGFSSELDAEEVSQKAFTVIGDIPRVDLLTIAHKVDYNKAIKTAEKRYIERVLVPYVDLKTLLLMKKTKRPQDIADSEKLKKIAKMNKL